MPAKYGVEGDDRDNLLQRPPAESLALRCEPPSLVISQAEAFTAEVLTEDSILLLQITDDGLPVPFDPATRGDDQQLPATNCIEHPAI